MASLLRHFMHKYHYQKVRLEIQNRCCSRYCFTNYLRSQSRIYAQRRDAQLRYYGNNNQLHRHYSVYLLPTYRTYPISEPTDTRLRACANPIKVTETHCWIELAPLQHGGYGYKRGLGSVGLARAADDEGVAD
jgi:CMP-N-acetylneuraminic acid synthetase